MNNLVQPRLSLMTDEEQFARVHHYALRILSETGVRVDAPSASPRDLRRYAP